MTDRFVISSGFDRVSRKIIREALKMSKLPEGVRAVCWNESTKAKKPFVVIAHSPRWKDARNTFQDGALGYVVFSSNPAELSKRLDNE